LKNCPARFGMVGPITLVFIAAEVTLIQLARNCPGSL